MARLDELERKFEENPRRYFAPLANEYRKAGDAGRAVVLCRAQLPDIPGHISGHIVLGQALYDVGDYPGSRSALEMALALDPENIVALRYLGDIARDSGDVAEAARWYTRTLEADPYSEAAQAGLESLKVTGPEPIQERQEIEPQSAGPPVAELEAPELEAPELEAPELEAPELEAPELEAPELEAPELEAPELEAPESEAPELEAPEFEAREVEAPKLEAAEVESPDVQSPEVESLAVESLGPQVVDVASPESPAADSESPTMEVDQLPIAEMAAGIDPADEPAVIAEPSADFPEVSAEFAGDLDVSAVTEPVEPPSEEPLLPEMAPGEVEAGATGAVDVATEVGVVEDLVVDVEAHRTSEPVVTEDRPEPEQDVQPGDAFQAEEAIQAEERVLEAAAPFVTETMADLYMEQGHPHEALELMLQLSEQRPEDESLRLKIGRIESAIMARRDAAVAVARAERAEVTEAQPATETPSDLAVAEAPSVSAVAEVFAPDLTPPATISVRDLFARMDGSRPRAAPAARAQPAPVLRSDFVPMPETRSSAGAERKFDTGEHRAGSVPRSSGSHQTFDPSTAGTDDFDAWLRGLRGP